MTDRINTLTVVLDQPIRDDDCKALIDAIKLLLKERRKRQRMMLLRSWRRHMALVDPQPEPQELPEEIKQVINTCFERLYGGRCPVCNGNVVSQEQIGMYVYARPCGHRMYQGKPYAFREK